MIFLSLLLYNVFTTPLHADVLTVEKLSVSYAHYLPGGYEPLLGLYGLDNRRLNQKIALDLDVDMTSWFFWRNNLYSITDKDMEGNGQHRVISYTYSLGMRLINNLELSYEHNSKHILDGRLPDRYPLNDSIKLELLLIGDKQKAGIFD